MCQGGAKTKDMTIHFYLNNEVETAITSLYDMQSNPFNLNDVVNLNVEELYPADYNKFKQDYQLKMIADNKELETTFKRKKVKLVREGKWMEFKIANSPRLTIEYHCEFVD